jgi:subtilisin family serine protease
MTRQTARELCLRTLVLGALGAVPITAHADQPPQADRRPTPGLLQLRTGDVDAAQAVRAAQSAPGRPDSPRERFVVQLDGPMTPERRSALRAAGVRLGDYLPTDAFIADLGDATSDAVLSLGFVTSVVPYQRAWRLDPEIGRTAFQTPERRALAPRGELALNVYLFAGSELAPALAAIRTVPGARLANVDLNGGQYVAMVTLPAARAGALADLPAVQYVEEYPEFVLRNSTTRWIVQSDLAGITPLYDHGLHGEGQIIGHIDGRIGVNHCSFYDSQPIGPDHRKILAYNTSQGYNLHGTHTAGTAAGDGGTWGDTRGIAYLAKLVHNSVPSLTESQMFARLTLHRSQGATVHTNSWGNDGTTAYDGVCRAIDDFSWQYDDQLVCFAVTNLSNLKNPENAKNVLAIGACKDTPNESQHCSGGVGPTSDGRRKPEIYAPGCSTNSSSGSSGCSTSALTGTSMACPAVTGTAALVRQYFTAGFYPTGTATPADAFTPSGALLKAVLLNAAVDMTAIPGYPSNLEGWGRVLADNALYFPGDTRQLILREARNNSDAALSTGESASFSITVDNANEPLRITLAFHDAPAAVNASYAPVNDLDLVVTAPTTETYYGNYFLSGQSIPAGSPDPKNNVEQVYLLSPPVGVWTVTVSATAVNVGAQGYAVVVSGAVTDGALVRGDINCDGVIDFLDIDAFVLALSDPAGYAAAYPDCNWLSADCNGDGVVDFDDVNAFVALLSR